MEYRTKVIRVGKSSLAVILPKAVCDWMSCELNTAILIEDRELENGERELIIKKV